MRTLFHGGTVFDGTGHAPAPADVVVEAGRIIEVGTGLDGDAGIDMAGRVLLPGFIDCHTHVALSTLDVVAALETPYSYGYYQTARNLRTLLATGITFVRDAGGADLGVQRAVADGLIAGPALQIAISMISQTGGHADPWAACGSPGPALLGIPTPGRPDGVADGPEAVRRKVRELLRAGADVIKVATSGGVLSARDDPRHAHLRLDELRVLVDEATAANVHVMAHSHGADGIKNAIRAGVRSVEHGTYLDDEAIGLMLDHGVYLVPTLLAPRAVLEAAEEGTSLPKAVVDKARTVVARHAESVRRAIAAGVPVAMGTDSGVSPHGRNLHELALLVGCGLAPADALAAATGMAARLLGVAGERGTLEQGKRADLVVIDGDPLHLESLPGRVVAVYQNGVRRIGATPDCSGLGDAA